MRMREAPSATRTRHLVLPRRRPGHEQVGDVQARHGEQQHHRAPQDPDGARDGRADEDSPGTLDEAHAPVAVGVRVELAEVQRERAQVGARLRQRHPGARRPIADSTCWLRELSGLAPSGT